MLPTPPVAPVTTTGPRSGVIPACSSASTDCAAVNPAVPSAIASRGLKPKGNGTNHSAGARVNSA